MPMTVKLVWAHFTWKPTTLSNMYTELYMSCDTVSHEPVCEHVKNNWYISVIRA